MNTHLGCSTASGLLAIGVMLGTSTTPASAGTYRYTPIMVPGSTADEALSVNDNGTVVGYFDSGTLNDGTRTGYVFRNGVVTELPASYGYTSLTSINDRGIAVGYQATAGYNTPNGLYYDARTNTLSLLTFRYVQQKTVLSVPGAISDSRMIVGIAENSAEAYSTAFLIGPGLATVLQPPRATPGAVYPASVNDVGTVAGTYTGPQGDSNSFTYSNGTYVRVMPPGAFDSSVSVLSNAGVVGGAYSDAHGTTAYHGYTWDGTSYRTFDVPGATSTSVAAFGGDGEIFGTYVDASGASHGFGLVGGTYFTFDYPGASSTIITSANAAGTIAGYVLVAGTLHSFTATCPLHQNPCTK